MGLQSAPYSEPHPLDEPATEVLQLLSSLTLAVFTVLGPSRLSRLLDAIAEHEFFQDELTMVD